MKTLRRDHDAGEPTLIIPRVGSAYKPEGYSRHSPDQLSIFIILRDNRYRCLDLTDSRSTTTVRTTSNIGACSVVPPSHCGYPKGEPSPYLVSRRSRRARLSYYRASHGHEQGQTHGDIRLSCLSDTIPARAPMGHPTPYLQERLSIQVPTNKYNQEESVSMVHLRWSDRDTSGMN